MLRSLQTSVRLLALCAVLLIIAVVYLILSPDDKVEIGEFENPEPEEIVIDPLKMDSSTYASYLKVQEGEKLFKDAGCVTCHDVCHKKVGPALKGVTKRRDREWIYKAVINFSALRASGDKTAQKLYEEYNKIEMPIHNFLDKEQLDKILYYIDSSYCKANIVADMRVISCYHQTL